MKPLPAAETVLDWQIFVYWHLDLHAVCGLLWTLFDLAVVHHV